MPNPHTQALIDESATPTHCTRSSLRESLGAAHPACAIVQQQVARYRALLLAAEVAEDNDQVSVHFEMGFQTLRAIDQALVQKEQTDRTIMTGLKQLEQLFERISANAEEHGYKRAKPIGR